MSQTQLDANKVTSLRRANHRYAEPFAARLHGQHRAPHRVCSIEWPRFAPSTAAEIARATHLDERYVREWLSSMVTGRIVDYDGRRGTFHLPPEHAACLDPRCGSEQPRDPHAVRLRVRRDRESDHRRMLPEGRWRALRALPRLPRCHFRAQRVDARCLAHRPHPADGRCCRPLLRAGSTRSTSVAARATR